MGNSLTLSIPIIDSCITTRTTEKVLRIEKIDGKILEFKKPVIVKDILKDFQGCSGIGVSKKSEECLPLNYQLKLGKIYYVLEGLSSNKDAADATRTRQQSSGGVKRIKVVVTKQQLEQLLTKEVSMEEVLSMVQRSSSGSNIDSPRNYWKPELESIPEGSEQ